MFKLDYMQEKTKPMKSSETDPLLEIVLFNDSENSMEYVMSCLVRYCNHNPLQAEQCAIIAHYNGGCSVKYGHMSELLPIVNELKNKNLNAELVKP
jgi:ATP-dependent Clp protease adaptor protein ClpS